jgi:hypothetical protein
LTNLSFPSDSLVFAALDVDAKSSIADIASADRVSDRVKMFYREYLSLFDVCKHTYMNIPFGELNSQPISLVQITDESLVW